MADVGFQPGTCTSSHGSHTSGLNHTAMLVKWETRDLVGRMGDSRAPGQDWEGCWGNIPYLNTFSFAGPPGLAGVFKSNDKQSFKMFGWSRNRKQPK